ncbi:MAG: AraC family transcriptional regulator [Spongiibacter sp.]|uniref:AraC family transcriptional regulator n=1 Tax=Spongiibacter TaxID=630749 RepID=UPI001B01CFC9|nr:AraC family transcriptional regulator [Spongiibacter sp.]MBO6753550.1 AraC family transcriptional regulator [Spongiibacter sp.]
MNDAKNLAKTATTIASYSLAIQKALEANGYDAEDIFEAAGIGRVPGPDPMDRLTTAELAAVYRESVKRSGNPAFGLTVARFMHPGAVHALGYALLASSSLRDACERLVYYFRLASEQGIYRIEEEGDRFCLILDVTTEGVAYETIDAWNAFVIRIFRMIYRPDFTPLSVSLTRPCPPGIEEQYKTSFHVPVTFDAPNCQICMERAIVDEPLSGGNREIASQHDQIMEGYIAALDQDDIITRVKRAIVQFLPSENCTKQRVASELAMSPNALQQKLATLDTSFQDLLNQIRQSLAMDYMEQSRVSITEMSFLLGFSDTSSFTRAFRRWTGKSPRDFRRERSIEP